MWPPLMLSSVIRMRSTVDLPEPDGPMIVHLLAGGDGEIQFVEHDMIAEALHDLVEDDDRLAHLRGNPVLGRLTSSQRTKAEATRVRMR